MINRIEASALTTVEKLVFRVRLGRRSRDAGTTARGLAVSSHDSGGLVLRPVLVEEPNADGFNGEDLKAVGHRSECM